MARYEVWDKQTLGTRQGQPIDTYYTLDEAMLQSKRQSKGTTKKSIWDHKSKDPSNPWGGGMIDVEIPNMVALIEKGDKQSRIRGYGIDGVWYDFRDCKRCGSTGTDVNAYELPCSSCKGSSYRPKI